MNNTVSIIVPVYNAEKYLDETVSSIICQTYNNIEIILVDDGSSDSSGERCDAWEKIDDRITVIHTENKGPSAARNRGISIPKGDYILPVDSDDLIGASYVEKAAKVLDSDEEIGIVYCRAHLFGDMSDEWNIPNFSVTEMLVSNCIFCSAMFRKNDWEVVGGYSSAMNYGLEDYDFWLSILSLQRKVFQIPEVLFWYRRHSGSRNEIFEENPLWVKETNNLKYIRHKDLYSKYYYDPRDNDPAVVYGCGGAGKSYINYLRSAGKIKIIQYCVDKNYKALCWIEDIKIEDPAILQVDKTNNIIIALNEQTVYMSVVQMLLYYGYSREKIHWYINKNELYDSI